MSAFLLVPVLLVAQGVTINVGTQADTAADRPVSVVSDSTLRVRAARDSAQAERRRARIVVPTPEHLATAFAEPAARDLFERARTARLTQDSLLVSYAATANERLTVGISLGRVTRERILVRYERAVQVNWHRDHGARVEILGERATAPAFGGGTIGADLGEMPPIPYFPGRDPLWGWALARANVSESEIINPLAGGAEAYYTYAVGDSAAFRLPGGVVITLRELRVQPRAAEWRVLRASLWFDADNGRLVRAVYRMADQLDIMRAAQEEEGEACEPRIVCTALQPMTMDVPVVTVEYGLHEGRFWLPRAQFVEGHVRVGVMRVPFRIEQSYAYQFVNGGLHFDPVIIAVADTARDSLSRAARVRARRAECSDADFRERVMLRFDNTLAIRARVSCDTAALARSSALPASPFDDGDELFGSAERDELIAMARALGVSGPLAPQRPVLVHPVRTLRYNRVEGLSAALAATQSLGAGYTAHAELRGSWADRQVNAELGLQRSDGQTQRGVAVYRRLAAANDWGNPFGLGNSLGALLSGSDEGFYYRTLGAEVTRETVLGGGLFARAFIEHHGAARTAARTLGRRRFGPNIEAEKGTVAGGALRWMASRGLDPRGFRAYSDARVEAAAGAFDYARGVLDLALSRKLAASLDGAVTLAAGTTAGAPPVQRWWFLGGAHTIRGQPTGSLSGNSFWMARTEFGSSFALVRPVVFADIGWAGDRSDFGSPGQPMSGAGVGASFLDGMIRFDLARGIRPERSVRGYLYLEARF